MKFEYAKRAAAKAAVALVKEGMTIGLGSGTTAHYFIENLTQKIKNGLQIRALASSLESEALARKGGIPLLDAGKTHLLDLTVDGADEIDHSKRMIKGAGGALVREKIMASMSREMVVIVDESKQVEKLGKALLPVEIVPYGCEATRLHLEKSGYKGLWRQKQHGGLYITDNGNQILDIHFEKLREHPEKDDEKIRAIPGVVDTGFFFHLAGRVMIGYLNGEVRECL